MAAKKFTEILMFKVGCIFPDLFKICKNGVSNINQSLPTLLK